MSGSAAPTSATPSRWWDLAFVAVPAVAAVAPLATAAEGVPLVALVCLVAVPVGWFSFGRLSFRHRAVAITFQALLVALLGLAIASAPNVAVLQAIVYPLVWTLSRSVREAIAGNVVVAVVVAVAFVVAFGGGPDAVLPAVTIALLSLAFSLAFGLWMTRVAEWGEERARLLDELQSTQQSLAAANREAGVATERERLSREVHDTLAQSLTGLVLLAQRANSPSSSADGALRRQLVAIEEVAATALAEARALVAATAPVAVDGGIGSALERLADRFSRETETAVEVRVDADVRLSRENQVVVLRCVQEAVANVRKHAGATRVAISMATASDGAVSLTVADDGVGVDRARVERSNGFGLAGMRDRLAVVGGTLEVEPRSPRGTLLTVSLPAESGA